MYEPGLDRHLWESEWEQLQPLLEDSPGEVLPELERLIGQMLVESDYPIETEDRVDDEGIDPEVLASFRSARDFTRQVDSGEDVDPGDVAQAIELYREIYNHLIAREADLS